MSPFLSLFSLLLSLRVQLELISWARGVPGFPSVSGILGLNQGFRIAAQDVRFQPVLQPQPEFLFGTGRHPIIVLIGPRSDLVQRATRLYGPQEALVGQGQPLLSGHCDNLR
jgi:hypothetical protein